MKKTTRYIALSLTALPVCILAVSCASDEPTANGRPRYALEVGNITLADYTETPWNGKPGSRMTENDDLSATLLEWNGTETFIVRELSDDAADCVQAQPDGIGEITLVTDPDGRKKVQINKPIMAYRDLEVNKYIAFTPNTFDITDQTEGLKYLLISDTATVAKDQGQVDFNFHNGLGILRVYVTGPYADEVKTIEFDSKKQAGVRITPERGFHVRPFGGYGYIKTKKHVTASGTFWQAAVVPDELSKVSGSGKIVHLSNVEYIRINGDKTYSLIEAFKSGSNENDIIAAGKITILTITCNNKP